jgi:hypothetical protein
MKNQANHNLSNRILTYKFPVDKSMQYMCSGLNIKKHELAIITLPIFIAAFK